MTPRELFKRNMKGFNQQQKELRLVDNNKNDALHHNNKIVSSIDEVKQPNVDNDTKQKNKNQEAVDFVFNCFAILTGFYVIFAFCRVFLYWGVN